MLNAGASDSVPVESEATQSVKQWLADLGWNESTQPVLACRLAAPRRIIPTLAEACLRLGLLETPSEILADPGYGTVRVLFWGDADDVGITNAIDDVRTVARRHGASAVVEICHPSIKARLDVWGEEPESMEIMRRVKDQLDPQHLLNRGRFLGRI